MAEQLVGTVMGIGGSHAREGDCYPDGSINGTTSQPTPHNSDDFFTTVGNHIKQADEKGAEWSVIGVPGPASMFGRNALIGPFANIKGLSDREYSLTRELVNRDPELEVLLQSGYTLITVNDGNLAAHAAAARFAQETDNTVAVVINGTGIGAGIVDRAHPGSPLFVATKKPAEYGHLASSDSPLDTFESLISGTAIKRRFGTGAENLPAHHGIFDEVGYGMGRLATMLALIEGADLVVPTGGVGIGAQDKYRVWLEDYMENYREFGNGAQKKFTPRIEFVPVEEMHNFELFGALGVAAAHLAATEVDVS